MNVLITGSDGFIGKNLAVKLLEHGIKVLKFNRIESRVVTVNKGSLKMQDKLGLSSLD